MKADIRKRYENVIRPEWMKLRKLSSQHQVPMLRKVVINMGLGRDAQDRKVFEAAKDALSMLSGQNPYVTRAKKSIAGFKLREGMVVGLKVTLRRCRMDEFIERLINIAMPRIRDFRGISSKSFDGRGGISFGIKDHGIFPEVQHDERILGSLGMDICISTTANTNADVKELLEKLGFPFYE